MEEKKSLVVFQDKRIRRTWHNDEWYFVVEDIVQALTGSNDVKSYISKMKLRDEGLSKGWGQIVRILSYFRGITITIKFA